MMALIALTPGTTCVLLEGMGIGHYHLGEDEAVPPIASDDTHHRCGTHVHDHDHGFEADAVKAPDPVPCPEADGISLESDLALAKLIAVEPAVWTLVGVAEWSDEIQGLSAISGRSGIPADLLRREHGPKGEDRVLFCRFLI